MPAGVDRIADPFATAGRGDIGEPLARCRAHLLKLVQGIGSRLFEKWPPLFSHFDCIGEVNGARVVWHFTDHFQWRAFAASWLKVDTERLCQLQLRYSQVVLGSNQLRNLVVQLHVRLQNVEPWNCSCFEPVLLVLQLSFQKTHVFLVHFHKLAIDYDLVKLRFHRRDERVQNIAESEVCAVALKKSAPDLIESCAVKNELRSRNTDRVGDIALLNIPDRCWRCSSQWCTNIPDLRRQSLHKGCGGSARRKSRRWTGVAKYARAGQVRIDPLEIGIRIDLRQGLRTHLNNHASGSFDLLLRVEKRRVALQGCQDRLVQGKRRQLAFRYCSASRRSFAAVCSLAA